MSKRSCRCCIDRGFTLIEVIISLGVFGLIIGGLFSLLPWGVDNVHKLSDRNTALGLVDAVQIEIQWPYKVYDPAGTDFQRTIEPRYRSSISFPLAIVR